MKRLIINSIQILIFTVSQTYAQKIETNTQQIYKTDLPTIFIAKNVNLHFRTPEPVQFVDISTNELIGDLPTENVVRIKTQQYQEQKTYEIIKRKTDETNKKQQTVLDTIKKIQEIELNFQDNQELGIITIVGQSFMAQYRIVYQNNANQDSITANIEVSPKDMQPLEFPKIELSNYQMKDYAMLIIQKKANKKIRKTKKLKLTATLNSLYTLGNYIFIDLSFSNSTNLIYDIDKIKFSIDDKKIYNSTNIQSIDIEPIYKLYDNKNFKKTFRNIYVFKKFTYPNSKILNVRLIENQISGRTINLGIKYSDILEADTF